VITARNLYYHCIYNDNKWSTVTVHVKFDMEIDHMFMELKMLPLPSQYIFFLLLFVINNMEQYTVNSEVYHMNTRQHSNLHLPLPNLTKCQKGVYCLGIKIFNVLLILNKSPTVLRDLNLP
jgi:hypothetical protein